MINYETILSNFDDKVTLYNWLRKVEEALKNASATNFVVNKKGNATLSFSITFDDGTTLESGDIVLQQGESVDQARIASGILQLHLTNGTWLTAGNIKPVSNFYIDANQHLIVNYQDGTSQDLGAIFNGNVTISGNLTATGTIDGQLVTGNEIIEKMGSSYGANILSGVTNLNVEKVFIGAVKTGNKITFVVALNLTRTGVISSGGSILQILIPSSVGENLTPTNIGGANYLDVKQIQCIEAFNSLYPIMSAFYKSSNTEITITASNGLSSLPENKKCYYRYEVTFLLSNSLIQ